MFFIDLSHNLMSDFTFSYAKFDLIIIFVETTIKSNQRIFISSGIFNLNDSVYILYDSIFERFKVFQNISCLVTK